MSTSTCQPPTKPPRVQDAVASRLSSRSRSVANAESAPELRERRLDDIEAAKAKLWLNSLRLTELVYFLLIGGAVAFVYASKWSLSATGIAATASIVGMWAFARRMGPREERLRRMMDLLARKRRTCAECGYRLQQLSGDRCPECGLRFDPDDKRPFLAQQTLVMFSGQARMVSAVMIIFVLFWVSILASGGNWQMYCALALGLLLALQGIYWAWLVQAQRAQRDVGTPEARSCRHCGRELSMVASRLPAHCDACGQTLTYRDVFVRPDVRRLADRRVRRLVYASLMLRWGFFIAMFGGLLLVIQSDTAMRFFASLGFTRQISILSMMVPALAWMLGIAVLFRRLGRRIQRRLRRLFSAIAPNCRRCGNDLSETEVGSECPHCRAVPAKADLLG